MSVNRQNGSTVEEIGSPGESSPPFSGDHIYEEEPGEFEEDNYDLSRDHSRDFFSHFPQASKHTIAPLGRTSNSSSHRSSRASSDFGRTFARKSIKKAINDGNTYSIYEDEPPLFLDHDIVDLLPDDIHTQMVEYWQDIDDRYYPSNERAFEGINRVHTVVTEYPNDFRSQLLKDLDAPDDRTRITNQFRMGFNRVPRSIRDAPRVKSTLHTRANELVSKLEGITEEKLHGAKRKAYQILSQGLLTSESSKMAKMFGILLHTETDRFAETVKFINEHYYKIIAIDLQMPHKVRWQEVLELGLVRKKFVCEQIRTRCLGWEIDNGSGTWPVKEDSSLASSSDVDICGGGERGKELTGICEDDEDDNSTPPEKLSLTESSSLLNMDEMPGEDGYSNWLMTGKMDSGEMKLSLEFDSQEYIGEDDWYGKKGSQNSVVSYLEGHQKSETGSMEEDASRDPKAVASNLSGKTYENESEKASNKSGRSRKSKEVVSSENKQSKKLQPEPEEEETPVGNKKKKKNAKRKSGQKTKQLETAEVVSINAAEEQASIFNFEELEAEELDMEPEVSPVHGTFFDEYPGEFWEGEGYNSYGRESQARVPTVRVEPKGEYIRDFFWDSEPTSRQDIAGKLSTEGVDMCGEILDDEELYDYEDICYDRPEFFEFETETFDKTAKESCREGFHYGLFGREKTAYPMEMSLLEQLLSKWATKRSAEKEKRDFGMTHNKGYMHGAGDAGLDDNAQRYSTATGETDLSNDDEKRDTLQTQRHSELPWTVFDKHYDGLLKLHPTFTHNMKSNLDEDKDNQVVPTAKRPLLDCYIHLQNEIWQSFEIAFQEARSNVEKVMSSLRNIVSRAYPMEDPRDPCEPDETLEDLVAKGEELRDKYRHLKMAAAPKPQKVVKHVHLFGSNDAQDEFGGESYYESDEESEGTHGGSDKHSLETEHGEFVVVSEPEQETLPVVTSQGQTKEMSASSVGASTLKSVNPTPKVTDESAAKESINETQSEGSNQPVIDEGANSNEGTEEESDKKQSAEESEMYWSERASSVHATLHSDMDMSVAVEQLERVLSNTHLMDPEYTKPTEEEKKIMKRGKRALLFLKLNNWEKSLGLEADRLTRQLDLIESHAQQEFQLLKHIPYHIWERAKRDAASVYIDDLKKDNEIGEVFRCAIEYGSELYGEFFIDRYDLMMKLNPGDSSVALKYAAENLDLTRAGKRAADSIAVEEEENEE